VIQNRRSMAPAYTSQATVPQRVALLALEDGTHFWGECAGAEGEAFGEFVFNTGMTGYQEVLTDPSYCGQIVVMTYPEIGIYGINPCDIESARIQVSGFVVHRAVKSPFNQRATGSLTEFLRQEGVVMVEGVDTRLLTRLIRDKGSMRGAISTVDLDPQSLVERVRHSAMIVGRDLVQKVTPDETSIGSGAAGEDLHVVVVDTGVKNGIVRQLSTPPTRAFVSRVPYDVDAKMILALDPHGVLVANGPGDPAALPGCIELVQELLQTRVPLAGICLGHQLLGLAVGAKTYKMRFGHRGCNHPVKALISGRVLITSQNHGFALDPTSLGIPWQPLDTAYRAARPEFLRDAAGPWEAGGTMAQRIPGTTLVGSSPNGFGPVEITHLSLNDGTLEGLRLTDFPAFSVQYHPEASPGPLDGAGFFEEFVAMMEANCATAV
jgi:carbamoyl-phosphate synthase small subunit